MPPPPCTYRDAKAQLNCGTPASSASPLASALQLDPRRNIWFAFSPHQHTFRRLAHFLSHGHTNPRSPFLFQASLSKGRRWAQTWGQSMGDAKVLRRCSKGRHRPLVELSSNFTPPLFPFPYEKKSHLSFPARQFSSNFLLHPAARLFLAKRQQQPKPVVFFFFSFFQPSGPIQR